MTLAEKILASHAVVDAQKGVIGVTAVQPGDALFVRTDVRFSHDYVTAMADALFQRAFGAGAQVRDTTSVLLFRDHLTFLSQVMPVEHLRLGLGEQAARLAREQSAFAERHGIRLYGEVFRGGRPAGSEGICHNKIVEDVALPGQLIAGTDSHTCTAGAVGCFAFGVGSTDMANAWYTKDVRATVPETVRVELDGAPRQGVCAKDVVLHLLSMDYFRRGEGIGKVLEYSGSGLEAFGLDERSTLTNMAVEAGAFTGVIEPDRSMLSELARRRGLAEPEIARYAVRADPGAEYAARLHVALSDVEPMVATPGDPKNGIALWQLIEQSGPVDVDIAYGGSCTGGKCADMDMYARVLGEARKKGRRVASRTRLFIQFGSQKVYVYAQSRGYTDLFRAVGAELLDPSCGACIRAGPGISERADQVTVSAASRNFVGRSGPGRVYLASPLVVAASAIAGKIAGPEAL